MPYLGDFLGQLLSEITVARMQSDLEAVRVAELYAGHPYLKFFAVPRVRLPQLTLDVPVVIERSGIGTDPAVAAVVSAWRERFAGLLAQFLERMQLNLSAGDRRALEVGLDRAWARLETQPEGLASPALVADELVLSVVQTLGKGEGGAAPVGPARLEQLAVELRTAAREAFTQAQAALPRLIVRVGTAQLREAGPLESLTRLHLTVTENAVEWTVVDMQGEAKPRLIPE
jgi:hypothetical protein